MRRAVAGLALALAASACTYDFKNPAEQLGTGQALGRVVVDRGSGAEPLAGTQVAVENSPDFDQVTRTTGRFTLLSLPIGRHRVLFRKGALFSGERFVDIAAGEDGKPEGVNLGDVRLRASVTLEGTFTLPAGFSTSGYGSLLFDVTDEITGQPAALASASGGLPTYAYTLRGLSVGEHRIRFVVAGDHYDPGTLTTERRSFGAAPLAVNIPETSEGQLLTMAPIPLEPQAVGSIARGSFRFRVQAIGPGGPSAAAASTVQVYDGVTFDPLTLGSLVETLRPDSAGWVQADEPPGVYVVRVVPPPFTGTAAGQEVFWVAPDPVRLLVRSSKLTELGTLYLIDSVTGSGAAATCFSSADCSAGTCVAGLCQGGTPTVPNVVPLSMPYCAYGNQTGCISMPGGPCGPDQKGICLMDCTGVASGAMGALACFPDAVTRRCTPDGVVAVTGTSSLLCP